MSADSYVLIRKEKIQWVGYMQYASIEEVTYDEQLFCAETLENAIILAQEVDTEYGYRFERDAVHKQGSTRIDMDGIRGAAFLNSYEDHAVPM